MDTFGFGFVGVVTSRKAKPHVGTKATTAAWSLSFQSSLYAALQDQVAKKVPLTLAALKEAVDNIRGAVMICYPMGLPEWDLVRTLLEDREGDLCAQVRGIKVSTCSHNRG